MPPSNNSVVLIVNTDELNQQFTKDSMSLSTVENFLKLASQLTQIARKINPGTTFEIIEGSYGLAAYAGNAETTELDKLIQGVLENDSEDSDFVKCMREIQSVIQANGHAYTFKINTNGHEKNYTNAVKSARQFRTKRRIVNEESTYVLKFMKGKLFDAGGKMPNLHIEDVESNGEIKIDCTEKNAMRAINYLYQTIYVSVWEEFKGHAFVGRRFCDVYDSEETYLDFKNFYESLSGLNELDVLSAVHDKCIDLVKKHRTADPNTTITKNKWLFDLGYLRKFVRLFIHESVDVNVKNTILIATATFNDTNDLKSVWSQLQMSLKQALSKQDHDSN